MNYSKDFRPGRVERRPRHSSRPSRGKANSRRNSLYIRRASALMLSLLFVLMAVGISAAGQASMKYDAHLVESEPHLSAPLVDIRNCFRGCSDYVISVDGEERILDSYGALYDPQIGDAIDYVIDPTDPQWSVAVGEPEFWEPNPTADRVVLLVLLVMALGASAWTVHKLLPEDIQRISTRSPQPPESHDSWGA